MASKLFGPALLLQTALATGQQAVQTSSVSMKHGCFRTEATTTNPQALNLRDLSSSDTYATCGFRDARSASPDVCGGFCNKKNPFSYVACCENAETANTYSPYACFYYTTCYDATVSTTDGSTKLTNGDYVGALTCSEESSSYCLSMNYPEIDYSIWECGSVSGIRYDYYTSFTDLSGSTSTPGMTSTVPETTTAFITLTLDRSVVTSHATESVPSSTSNEISAAKAADSRSQNSGVIAGSVIGGISVGALAVVASLIVWHRRKQKGSSSSTSDPSFRVLHPSHPPLTRAHSAPHTPTSAPVVRSSSIETPSTGFRAVSTVNEPLFIPSYKPYNPSHDSTARLSSEAISRSQASREFVFHQRNSPYQQPSHHSKYNSLNMQSFLVANSRSAPNSRPLTPNRSQSRSYRGSRFAELEANAPMRSQAGPVPEWEQELP